MPAAGTGGTALDHGERDARVLERLQAVVQRAEAFARGEADAAFRVRHQRVFRAGEDQEARAVVRGVLDGTVEHVQVVLRGDVLPADHGGVRAEGGELGGARVGAHADGLHVREIAFEVLPALAERLHVAVDDADLLLRHGRHEAVVDVHGRLGVYLKRGLREHIQGADHDALGGVLDRHAAVFALAGLDRSENILDAGARTIFGGLGEDFARGLVRESPGGAEVRHARLGGGDGVRRAVAQAFRGVQDQAFGLLEPDAGVRDGDARIGRHAGHQVLLAGQQTAFEHQARDAVVSGELLRQDILEDNVLAGRVAPRIAVAAIDRERTRDAGVFELAERGVDARGIVVFAGDAPAQDQVAVRIALAADDAAAAVVHDADVTVRSAGGADGVNCDLQVAVGAVLEPDGHVERARELAVRLGLRGARTDPRPRNELGKVVRDRRVEQFRGGAEPVRRHVEQELAGEFQTARDVAAAVQIGVVHQPLPAERGARFLEIAPHHDLDLVGDAFREPRQLLRVFQRGGHVVDRARPGDDDQALVRPVEDLPQFRAVPVDVLHDVRVRREFGRELFGRFDRLFCLVHGMSFGFGI